MVNIHQNLESIFDMRYHHFNTDFITRRMSIIIYFKILQACGYQEPPSLVETAYESYYSTVLVRKCSATNIFISLDTFIKIISISHSSITIQLHINSAESPLI